MVECVLVERVANRSARWGGVALLPPATQHQLWSLQLLATERDLTKVSLWTGLMRPLGWCRWAVCSCSVQQKRKSIRLPPPGKCVEVWKEVVWHYYYYYCGAVQIHTSWLANPCSVTPLSHWSGSLGLVL